MKTNIPGYDAVIIGSGLSGLLCATILSKEGMRVSVLEKENRPGGCLQSFRRNGQIFDTGVHYFGSMDPGQPLHRYWNYFGLTSSLQLERLNPDGYDRILLGEKEYPHAMGFDNFIEQLLLFFPGEKSALKKYIGSLEKISSSFPLYNLEYSPGHSETEYWSQSAIGFYQNLFNPETRTSAAEKHTAARLAEVLSGNNFLYTSNPAIPLAVSALINHSFISSAWRTVGGSEQIVNHLVKKILDAGGEFHRNARVSNISKMDDLFRIETEQSGDFFAKRVISSMAPPDTFSLLDQTLVRRSTMNRMKKLKNTHSSFGIYLTLKEAHIPQLDYNCHIHINKEILSPENQSRWPNSCMIYTPPGAKKSSFASAMVIMSPMNYSEVRQWEHTLTGNRGKEYLEFKEEKSDQLLRLAEIKFPSLRSSVSGIDTSSPLTWRDYTGTPQGSMYGILKDYERPLETRILPKTRVPGLTLTGQGTNLHGMLGVTIGAVMTCGEIIGTEALLKKIRNV